ncbi:MAG: uracil phosphoribosyltransferase [Sphingobacteriaceae bacterium]|nr:MAG: uracil phosphoribosyltransferase [Sphingobacteriaceae bacterium]
MIFQLDQTNSVANRFIAEMRNVHTQQNPQRFRNNQVRLGEILAYEISKKLDYQQTEVKTPLGTASVNLAKDQPVLATILRAGLPFHQGFLNFFDRSASAFITAYRKTDENHDFTIQLEHISSPDLNNQTVIMCDTMLASGQSIVQVCKQLQQKYQLKTLHIAAVIASADGLKYVQKNLPEAHIWVGSVDQEMNSYSYIIPGLGDAGDLSFGEKV